jgi:hypothetical protein
LRRTPISVVAVLIAGGCLDAFDRNAKSIGDNATDGGTGPVGSSEFKLSVEPILTQRCGGCHATPGGAGPAFLQAKPDMLTTLLSYPGLIGGTPDLSRIFTKGVHEGPALTASESTTVSAWITKFGASVQKQQAREKI